MNQSPKVRKTPLHDEHVAAGGRLVEFAGYELPVQYTSLTEEHQAVRTRAGLFDVSHMGEIAIRGPMAFDFVQLVSCNDHSKMVAGRAQYTGLMYPEATFVDDVLVHKMADDDYLLVVNAANRHKDVAYLTDLAEGREGVEVTDLSDDFAQIALQGPLAAGILAGLTPEDLSEIKYYRFVHGEVAGAQAMIARTGYTGEDGFEVYTNPDDAPGVWRAILADGRPKGLLPAGLGARDTLRFEAGMCLYGNDIDDTTTPLEAGLGWIVKLAKKGDFVGRDVLELQKGRPEARWSRNGGSRHRPARPPGVPRRRRRGARRHRDLGHPVAHPWQSPRNGIPSNRCGGDRSGGLRQRQESHDSLAGSGASVLLAEEKLESTALSGYEEEPENEYPF